MKDGQIYRARVTQEQATTKMDKGDEYERYFSISLSGDPTAKPVMLTATD